MSITFLVPLFFASPPHNACTEYGVPMLEMRQRSTASTSSTTTKIFASGAWTVTRDGHLDDRGCFDRKEVRSIYRAVERAPWQTVSSPVMCFRYDPNFTEYVVDGKLRFTEQFCSGKTADLQTLQAIDLVKHELATDKPIAPLFEIRKRSDIAAPTADIKIYDSGAWTYQPIDKAGHPGAITTGTFDRRTLALVKRTIDRAPWDTTFSRIVCRAYSPSFTQYYVHGKLEFTARLCGAERLDERSRAAIAVVERELAIAQGSATAPQPVSSCSHT